MTRTTCCRHRSVEFAVAALILAGYHGISLCDEPDLTRFAPPSWSKTATFSIIAVDPKTGVCGAAVASKYPAVGKVVPYVRPGVGAFCTQHYHVPDWGERALTMLEDGHSVERVIVELLKDDERPGQRQLALIDVQGRTVVHNPSNAPQNSRYWGSMQGRYYACQGNTLAGRQVITAMAKAYEETTGSFADRLMAALVAADEAGGDHRGRQAAGIRIAKTGHDGLWFELYVDDHVDAVTELSSRYAELEHAAKAD